MEENTRNRSVSLLIALLAGVALSAGLWAFPPLDAHADEAGSATQLEAAAPAITETLPDIVFSGNDLEASADLPGEVERFAGYARQVFASNKPTSRTLSAQKVTRGSLLGDQEKIVYDILSERICKIAAGKESSSVIDIPLEDLGVQKSYTAADIGLESIFQDETHNVVSEEARAAVNSKFNVALMRILNSVLADYPYELYWYDKTAGISFSPPSISAIDNGEGGAITFARPWKVVFKMCVSAYYSETGAVGTFAADTNATAAASRAAEKASAIVAEHASKSDYDKLHYYMEAIAKLTDYNYDAATDYNATAIYGDPWQLIYVFDDNPDTKVVCEGYAKAFQYLCDLSAFEDQTVSCFSVTGDMHGGTGSGPHMWNVVSIGGANYLVDVTNNDNYLEEGKDITTPNDELFLAGAEGSVYDGYSVVWPNPKGGDDLWIVYYYDDEALYYYDEAELTISATSYGQAGPGGGGGDPDQPDPSQPTDAERAQETYALINAIGKVSYDSRTKSAIDAARASYDALSDAQKALVGNYAALANAESRYNSLANDAKAAQGNKESESKSSDSTGTSGSHGSAKPSTTSPSGSTTGSSSGVRKATAKKITSVTVNAKKVTAKTVKKAIGKNKATVKTITIGKNAKSIAKNAFKAYPKVKTIVLKTKKLKKSTVKKCLAGSKVNTVRVAVGSAKANETYAKKYKKIFVKKVVGKKVAVKAK